MVCQDAQQTGCVIPDDKEEEETAKEAHETTPMSISLDACVDGIEGAAPAGRTARPFYFMAAAHAECPPPPPPAPHGVAPPPTTTPSPAPPPSTPPHPPPPDCLPRMTMDMAGAELLHDNLGGKGPDAGEEVIHYGEVGTLDGQPFDLKVSAIGPYANAGEDAGAAANGKAGSFGAVNVGYGEMAKLQFAFYSTATGEEVDLPEIL